MDIYNAINRDNMSIREAAKHFNVNFKTIEKWSKREPETGFLDKKRQRTKKLKEEHLEFMKKLADGKSTGKDQASSRIIARELIKRFKNPLKPFSIHPSTVNKTLNTILSKPRSIRDSFKLTDINKGQRRSFCDYINKNQIEGRHIFFTDESKFSLETRLNKSNNKIRLSKENQIKLKNNDP
jgi:DNA-binding transcriptional regulator YhcF (GntR family)